MKMKKVLSMVLVLVMMYTFVLTASATNTGMVEGVDITRLVNRAYTGNWQLDTSRNHWELDSLNRVQFINGG